MSDQPSSNSQTGSDSVQRGGAGMDKTPANPDGGKPDTPQATTTKAFNPADEPDFAKTKPGNPPHILGNVIEGLTAGTTRSS
ncbi:uncharacterized protein LY89DRAFT_687601 [Mollisia scopiformis]|uniref:Uncharacterized protein n=1 Tax=Mollisia scopiformis TaxID=149040 RepID=A0A194X027_MOLSC|nr:uncharacterized protein LY89DRAFT_687601 [Mollisia scopiformis]KUJ13545.1 hypothetical protein LY89DRAFT_687601 [Mollisia scopiformis]